MKKAKSSFFELFFRYFIIIFFLLFGAKLLSLVFIPLTVTPIYLIINFLYGAMLNSTKILVGDVEIEIVGSCVAVSAYLLLLILNLATPGIKVIKRTLALIFSFLLLFAINLIRILLLSFLLIQGSSIFDITHKLFWYGLSTIFVVGIWFLMVKIFKIKEIPFYSDLKSLFNSGKKKH